MSGYVYDGPSRRIRPLVGIPGSAYLGAPVSEELDTAWIAPGGGHAVGLRGGAVVLFRDLRAGESSASTLADAMEGVDQVVWANDSSACVLYASASGRLERLTGIPRAPVLSGVMDSNLPPGATLLAAGQSANDVLFAAGDAVWLLHHADFGLKLDFPAPAAAAFAPDLARIFAVGASGQLIQLSASGAGAGPIASLRDVADVAALAVSRDGRSLYIAVRRPARLFVVATATGTILSEIPLEVDPEALSRLSKDIYLVNPPRAPGRPIFILDASFEPVVWFVPAGGGAE